jgi:hypothetical protein
MSAGAFRKWKPGKQQLSWDVFDLKLCGFFLEEFPSFHSQPSDHPEVIAPSEQV